MKRAFRTFTASSATLLKSKNKWQRAGWVCIPKPLIIIKLGDKEYNGEKGDEGYELLRFLNAIMYPHKDDFMETISDYIDFSDNEELWKEEPRMFSLSQCIYEDGYDDGKEQGIEQGIEQGEEIKLI